MNRSSHGSYSTNIARQRQSSLVTDHPLSNEGRQPSSDEGTDPTRDFDSKVIGKHGTADDGNNYNSSCSKTDSVALVDWFTDVLGHDLQKVIIKRNTFKAFHQKQSFQTATKQSPSKEAEEPLDEGSHFVNLITDVLEMPDFEDPSAGTTNLTLIAPLRTEVQEQLKQFVRGIAESYRDHPFHNCEHASHVAMSASKILKTLFVETETEDIDETLAKRLTMDHQTLRETHDATFGISSDPLMHFAILFAALIHDVDHTGPTYQQ